MWIISIGVPSRSANSNCDRKPETKPENPMRLTVLSLCTLLSTTPAFATGGGAIAWDRNTGKYGASFNQSIHNFFNKHKNILLALSEIHFGYAFNHPVEDVEFPPNLNILQFGKDFAQPIGRLRLPSKLTHLLLDSHFNHPIGGLQIPESLTHIEIGYSNSQLISNGTTTLKLSKNKRLKRIDWGYYKIEEIVAND